MLLVRVLPGLSALALVLVLGCSPQAPEQASASQGPHVLRWPERLPGRAAAKAALVHARLEVRRELPGWAGIFHAGAGHHGAWELQTLILAPNAGFVREWPVGPSSYDWAVGEVSAGDGALALVGEGGYAEACAQLVPVRWGARMYLVHGDELEQFVAEIHSGVEPRDRPTGRQLLRAGDERSRARGRPDLPAAGAALLLAAPIEVGVVDARIVRGEGGELARLELELDGGSALGLRSGHRLGPLHEWLDGARVEAVEAQRSRAVLQAELLLEEVALEALSLAPGTRLSTACMEPSSMLGPLRLSAARQARAIDAELRSASGALPPWAGHFERDATCGLRLAPGAGFLYEVDTRHHGWHLHWGSAIEVQGGVLRIAGGMSWDAELHEVEEPEPLLVMPWGPRTYLLEEEELEPFVHAVNDGSEPRGDRAGRFFLRRGHELLSAPGPPPVPPDLARLLLTEAVEVLVLEVSLLESEGEEPRLSATVRVSEDAGLLPGHRLHRWRLPEEHPERTYWRVLTVDGEHAEIELVDRLLASRLRRGFDLPRQGEQLSTRRQRS
jgi:hypothetical protein